jgi:tetratricopeptide (TPR) repeat protein
VIAVNAVDRTLGREPRGFRGLGFALGAVTVALFTVLAWVLCRSAGAALACGAIAAVHPVLIEVHVWIAGFANVLVAAFTISSLLLAALAFREHRAGRAHALGAGSAGMLILALLSKENSIAIPGLLLALALHDRAAGSGPHFRRVAAWLLPTQIVVTGVYAAVWRPFVLGGDLAVAPPIGESLVTHVLTCMAAWPRSLAWLLFPVESSSSDVVRLASLGDVRVWAGLVLVVGSVAAGIALLRRGQPLAALALAWVWIAFAPSSGIVPLTHARAERYVHLSLYGAALIPAAVASLPSLCSPRRRLVAGAIATLVVLGLAERTLARLPDWQSNTTLFARDVARDPLYREGAYMLARAQIVGGRPAQAKATLEAMIGRLPEFAEHASYLREVDFAELYCIVNLQVGKAADSLRFVDWIQPSSPNPAALASLYYCAALGFETLGQLRRAAGIQQRLFEVSQPRPDPRYALALARCYTELGELGTARRWLRQARPGVARDPSLARDFNRAAARLRDATRE